MEKKKRITSLLLILSLILLTMSACGQNQQEGEGKGRKDTVFVEVGKKEGSPVKIGIAIYDFDDKFMASYMDKLTDAFDEQGEKDGRCYQLDFRNGGSDSLIQTEELNHFVTNHYDAIVANMNDPDGAPEMIRLARDHDVPIVFVNREPAISSLKIWEGRTAYVGVDGRQSGIYQGELIADLPDHGDLNGDGKVSYITIQGDSGNVDTEQRSKYSVDTLKKTVAVDPLGTKVGNWNYNEGREVMEEALHEEGDKIEVVFSNNDEMALGAIKALEKAGRKVNQDIYLVGVDAIPDALLALEAGELTGTVLNDAYNQSETTAELVGKLLDGEKIQPYYWHEYIKVSKSQDAEVSRSQPLEESFQEYEKRLASTYGY